MNMLMLVKLPRLGVRLMYMHLCCGDVVAVRPQDLEMLNAGAQIRTVPTAEAILDVIVGLPDLPLCQMSVRVEIVVVEPYSPVLLGWLEP